MKVRILTFLLLYTGALHACPFCNSPSAKKTRALLFGPDLLFNVAVTILPFILFTGIVLLIYHGGFPVRNSNK